MASSIVADERCWHGHLSMPFILVQGRVCCVAVTKHSLWVTFLRLPQQDMRWLVDLEQDQLNLCGSVGQLSPWEPLPPGQYLLHSIDPSGISSPREGASLSEKSLVCQRSPCLTRWEEEYTLRVQLQDRVSELNEVSPCLCAPPYPTRPLPVLTWPSPSQPGGPRGRSVPGGAGHEGRAAESGVSSFQGADESRECAFCPQGCLCRGRRPEV